MLEAPGDLGVRVWWIHFPMGYVSPLCHVTLGENGCSEQARLLRVSDSREGGGLGRVPPEAWSESRVRGQGVYLGGGTPLGCPEEQVTFGGSWGVSVLAISGRTRL